VLYYLDTVIVITAATKIITNQTLGPCLTHESWTSSLRRRRSTSKPGVAQRTPGMHGNPSDPVPLGSVEPQGGSTSRPHWLAGATPRETVWNPYGVLGVCRAQHPGCAFGDPGLGCVSPSGRRNAVQPLIPFVIP